MLGYNEIERYAEPLDILTRFTTMKTRSLMNKNDLTFLCGAIKQFSPRKILELGVAWGGTTAVIAQCVSKLRLESEIHSVDILQDFNGEKVGVLYEECKDFIDSSYTKHFFHLGNPIPDFIDEIGHNIDLVVIDTSHGLPGELLEFVTILPYLSNGACVVLHDTIDHLYWKENHGFEYATQLLFNTVSGDKYLNRDDDRALGYPNIAAFRVNDDTRKNELDCFNALHMTWLYLLNKNTYEKYVDSIRSNYDEIHASILESAWELNSMHFARKKKYIDDIRSAILTESGKTIEKFVIF